MGKKLENCYNHRNNVINGRAENKKSRKKEKRII